ncbi:MAG: hypothetical protein M1827_005177 [Pycnora praestabilis]|nr:MAG: hypothetical protein M1827_005177 [Pycnora praestabilis]
MSPKFVLLDFTLPVEAIQLGSLVPNVRSPQSDAFCAKELVEGRDFFINDMEHFSSIQKLSANSAFTTHLTRVLSLSHEADRSDGIQLSSQRAKTYELRQPKALFKEICTMQDAKDWLQDGLKAGENSYLITGFRTVFDAVYQNVSTASKSNSAQVNVPVSTLLTSGADVVGLGDVLDTGAGIGYGKGHERGVSFRAPGEKIWAVGYRRVTFKPLKHRGAETASLSSDIVWRMLSETRAQGPEAGEEVEVGLEDFDEGEDQFETIAREGSEEDYLLYAHNENTE